MMNDVLDNLKNDINSYQNLILNCTNIELRNTLQNIRNNQENFQYELYKLSETKGYSFETLKATIEDIENIKKEVM